MWLSESLLAEVKSLIAARLGLDKGSIDIGLIVSTINPNAGVRREVGQSESDIQSWTWSETTGVHFSTGRSTSSNRGKPT